MSYDVLENSIYSSAPVELFEFSYGGTRYRYTSSDSAQTYSGYGYAPLTMQRGEIRQNNEANAATVDITVPTVNPVAQLFVPYTPSDPVNVTVRRFHRGDTADVKTLFRGWVAACSFRNHEATLECRPIGERLRKTLPNYFFSSRCNHVLYGPGCGLNKDEWKVQARVDAISADGLTVTASELTGYWGPYFGKYNFGWVECGGETRSVVEHNYATTTITLNAPMPGLAVGTTFMAYQGCSRFSSGCQEQFNNLINFLGFEYIPKKNPWQDGL